MQIMDHSHQSHHKAIKKAAPARVCALQTLIELEEDPSAFCAETLDAFIVKHRLSAADARLASHLVYQTLRSAYRLDSCFQHHLRQSIDSLQPDLRWLLRMAACQAILMDKIPPHAIADDSVELARHVLELHPATLGFVNAVVRKILKSAPATRQALEAEESMDAASVKLPLAKLSTRLSLPEWICSYFLEKFQANGAWPVFQAMNTEPILTLRANTLRATPIALAEALTSLGGTISTSGLLPGAFQVSNLPAASLIGSDEFREGHFYIQDEASQLVSHLLHPVAGESVLDYCAAPGGKATHLFQLADGKAAITAHDISAGRLKLLQENIERLRMREITVASELNAASSFDAVLVDAPCSGLGTLRRNPEIRYRLQPPDLLRHAGKQLEILRAAAAHVKNGGRLVYSTCSVASEENAGVIDRFLKSHPSFRIIMSSNPSPVIQHLAQPDGFYRTWPSRPEVDGFEAVVLHRGE
jgi:16S rRNA (cytosine967-C5)-methyltransferase